jgi:hypothetical protein
MIRCGLRHSRKTGIGSSSRRRILGYIEGVSFAACAANDEKRTGVERHVFVLGEATGLVHARLRPPATAVAPCHRFDCS